MEQKPAHVALAEHIRAQGMKKQDFAKMVGVRNDHLSRWLAGKGRPARPTRMLIALVTDGAVPTEAWEPPGWRADSGTDAIREEQP